MQQWKRRCLTQPLLEAAEIWQAAACGPGLTSLKVG